MSHFLCDVKCFFQKKYLFGIFFVFLMQRQVLWCYILFIKLYCDLKLKIYVTAEAKEAIRDTAYTLGCHFSDLPQTLYETLLKLLSTHDFYRLLTMKAEKGDKKTNRLDLNTEIACKKIEEQFGFQTSGDYSLEKYSTAQRLFNALVFLKKNTTLNTVFFKLKIEKDLEGAKALLKEQLEKAFNEDSIC